MDVRNKGIIIFSVVILLGCVALIMNGCGRGDSNTDLNLPETETKQLESLEQAVEANEPMIREISDAGKSANPKGGEFKKFYIYADKGYFKNHYIPSGWMGDFGDVKFNESSKDDPYSRKTCIKVIYTAEKKQGAGWAGIYWQDPANNWGNLKGGYDLTGAEKLTFWARGAKGGEIITEFKIGGINGEHSDSTSMSIGPIELTPEWKEYTIDLKDEDLSLIIGGFSFIVSSMENPDGATFYIDDIAFE